MFAAKASVGFIILLACAGVAAAQQKAPAAKPKADSAAVKKPVSGQPAAKPAGSPAPAAKTGATAAPAKPAAPAAAPAKPAAKAPAIPQYYRKDERVISGGLALGGLAGASGGGETTIPPFFVAYDYGWEERVSLGGVFAFSQSEYSYSSWGDTYGIRYTYYIIGARGAYHFKNFMKDKPLDPYAGILIGYNVVSAETFGDWGGFDASASSSYIIWGGYLGLRYWFKPNLAAQLELGSGVGNVSLGVAYRL